MDTRHPSGHRTFRRGRRSLAGGIHLLTSVTVNRQRVFDDPISARSVARLLGARCTWSPHRCLCWVLMHDHFHALVQLGRGEPLATPMQRVKSRTSRAASLAGWDGSLWADGYHEQALRHEDDLLACARHVVANPLRAGLVDDVLVYPYWDAVWMDASARGRFSRGTAASRPRRAG